MSTPIALRVTCLALLTVAVGCTARPAQADPLPWLPPAPAAVADTGSLTITGFGSVRAPADHVQLRLSIEALAPTAGEASSRIATVADQVIEAVRPLLGEDDRLETAAYHLTPTYAPRTEGDPRITGYRASNTVLVLTDRVQGVGGILDAAMAAGANRIGDLSFLTLNDDDARTDAIRAAVEQARREAEATAAALGVELGEILSVQTNVQRPFEGGGRVMLEAARMDATPIEAGSNAVSANVTVTWRLVPAGGR